MQELYSAEERSFYMERLELSNERIAEIAGESLLEEPVLSFFKDMAEFIKNPSYEYGKPENYKDNWLNPVYAVKMLGQEEGRMMSFLAYA